MANRLKLVLLYGGKSGEHEISLISAASVLAHLSADKYEIIPIGMDKQGQFHLHDYQKLIQNRDKLPVSTADSKPLPSLLVNGHLAVPADVVFPVVHGPLYEDGCLQGLLELAEVAYVGCDVLSSALGMDKDMARRVACVDEVPSTRYELLSWHTTASERKAFCQKVADDLGWPLFVKPCSLGSSVGIHKANNPSELAAAIEDALRYDEEIMVEAFVTGREIELAVLENRQQRNQPKVSLPGEIAVHHPDGFYSYTAKYLESDCTELKIPAELPSSMISQLQDMAAKIFTRLKCKGMARVDFFVNTETGAIHFNEINTIPGFTAISMYPKMWAASGLAYEDLLDELVALALMHQQCRQQLVTDYL